MQEQPSPAERALDGNTVIEIIFEALVNTFIDWWYVWLGMAAVAVVLRLLTDWTKRVEARARAEKRARERAERQFPRR